MHHRIICINVISGCIISLLTVIATTAIADAGGYQQSPQYAPPAMTNQYDSRRPANVQVNPWQLPQEPVGTPGFEQLPKYQRRPDQNDQQAGQYQSKHNQMGRFVTPEILESLKHQQTRTQIMPGNTQRYRRLPQQSMPYQPAPGVYGAPSSGMGNPNPLYDAPAVSPWGNGSDLLYCAQSMPDSAPGSFPWDPN